MSIISEVDCIRVDSSVPSVACGVLLVILVNSVLGDEPASPGAASGDKLFAMQLFRGTDVASLSAAILFSD